VALAVVVVVAVVASLLQLLLYVSVRVYMSGVIVAVVAVRFGAGLPVDRCCVLCHASPFSS